MLNNDKTLQKILYENAKVLFLKITINRLFFPHFSSFAQLFSNASKLLSFASFQENQTKHIREISVLAHFLLYFVSTEGMESSYTLDGNQLI